MSPTATPKCVAVSRTRAGGSASARKPQYIKGPTRSGSTR